jgi:hypothetical protein
MLSLKVERAGTQTAGMQAKRGACEQKSVSAPPKHTASQRSAVAVTLETIINTMVAA